MEEAIKILENIADELEKQEYINYADEITRAINILNKERTK